MYDLDDVIIDVIDDVIIKVGNDGIINVIIDILYYDVDDIDGDVSYSLLISIFRKYYVIDEVGGDVVDLLE